jgi:hypothetical protein
VDDACDVWGQPTFNLLLSLLREADVTLELDRDERRIFLTMATRRVTGDEQSALEVVL